MVLDDKCLSFRDKVVLCSLIRCAYGNKVVVHPSQQTLAERNGTDRETVRNALKSLAELGCIEPLGKGKRGRAEHYRLNLRPSTWRQNRQANVAAEPPGSSQNVTAEPPQIRQAAPRQVGKTRERGVTSAGEVDAEPSEAGLGNGAAGTASDNNLAAEPPRSPFTKREVNELLLTPDGLRVNGSRDDLDYDLQNITLPMLGSEPLFHRELDELVTLRGVEFCQKWERWLPRKVAWYYAKGEPVVNPAGLYADAVKGGWDVDPAWPEFDETKHTWAARLRSEQRKQKAEVTDDAPLTPEELDEFIPF